MAFDGERASSRQDPMARPSLRKYLNVPITGFLEWLIDRQSTDKSILKQTPLLPRFSYDRLLVLRDLDRGSF